MTAALESLTAGYATLNHWLQHFGSLTAVLWISSCSILDHFSARWFIHCNIVGHLGSVTAAHCDTDCSTAGQFGSLTAILCSTDCSTVGKSGSLTAILCGTDCSTVGQFGSLTAIFCGTDCSTAGQFGSLTAILCGKDCSIAGQFGSLTAAHCDENCSTLWRELQHCDEKCSTLWRELQPFGPQTDYVCLSPGSRGERRCKSSFINTILFKNQYTFASIIYLHELIPLFSCLVSFDGLLSLCFCSKHQNQQSSMIIKLGSQ